MKYIGQHIYDLVSRFRNDVFFEGEVNFNTDIVTFTSASADDPIVKILNTTNDDQAAQLVFEKLRDDDAVASGQNIGEIWFKGQDTAQNTANYGVIFSEIDVSTHGQESGKLNLGVAAHDGDIGVGLILTGGSVDAEIDVEIGRGANSVVTIPGNIDLAGTLSTGTWQADVIASAYLDADTAHLSSAQTFTGAKTFNKITSAIFDVDISVTPRDGAKIHVDAATITDSNTSTSGTATMNSVVSIEQHTLAATNASVTNTHAASLYIANAPTAGTNMTLTNAYALWVDDGLVKFDGALTVGGTITGNVTGALTGQADTVATIAGLAPNTATTQATQPNIESIGTDGDTLSILSDTLLMSNTTNSAPTIKLVNTTDDNEASQIIFEKLRDDDGVASGQNLGEIWFRGQNSAQQSEDYAYIFGEIDVSTDGQESGQLKLGLANHDGGNGNGLILTGGSADNEIDVTVGLGAASVVTIPGDLTVNGDTVTFESANADDPTVIIKNTTADAQGARLQMKKDRGAAMVQGDRVGEIDFIGEDADQNQQQYAKIMVRADVVTGGQESGQMVMQVANHDGGLEAGLILEGGSEDGEIDVTVGLGANSVVTIPGNIDLAGDIDVDGTLETDALTIGGTTIAAIGTTAITTLGTIGTGVWNGTKITDVYTNSSGKRYGSTIKILPSDFMINDDAASPLSFKDGSNSGVHVNDAANEVVAFVTIPEGMKATLVDVYGTHNKTLKVWAPDLNASFDFTGTTLGTGATNTQLDITDTNATATNYLAIQVTLTATSQRIWGGIVTIAPQ